MHGDAIAAVQAATWAVICASICFVCVIGCQVAGVEIPKYFGQLPGHDASAETAAADLGTKPKAATPVGE